MNALAQLGRLQPSGWYSINAVVALFREIEPNFQRPTGRHDEWQIRRSGTGEALVGIEHSGMRWRRAAALFAAWPAALAGRR